MAPPRISVFAVGGPLDGRRPDLLPDVDSYTVPCDGSARWEAIRQAGRHPGNWEVTYRVMGIPGMPGAVFMAPTACSQGEAVAQLVAGYQGEAQRQERDERALERGRAPIWEADDTLRRLMNSNQTDILTPSHDRILKWRDR